MEILVKDIIDLTRKHLYCHVMVFAASAWVNAGLLPKEGDTIESKKYCKIMGKIMYLTNKIVIEGTKSIHEL